MRMPRVRFSVRGLMVVVAIAGVVFAVPRVLWLRTRYFLNEARYHALLQAAYNKGHIDYHGDLIWPHRYLELTISVDDLESWKAYLATRRPIPSWKQVTVSADRAPGISFYHWNLRNKYERAARQPWLPVAPDPPEPE